MRVIVLVNTSRHPPRGDVALAYQVQNEVPEYIKLRRSPGGLRVGYRYPMRLISAITTKPMTDLRFLGIASGNLKAVEEV